MVNCYANQLKVWERHSILKFREDVRTMRVLPIRYVKNGHKLAQTLKDEEGRILLRAGMEITPKMKKRLNDYGIYSIYVDDGYSDVELQDVIQPELRQKAVRSIKRAFNQCQISEKKADSKKQHLAIVKEREKGLSELSKLSESIMNDLLTNKDIAVNLVDIKKKDDFLFQHSMNVAVLSMIIGSELNINARDLKVLCLGAMLHDIGKTLIPEDLIMKKGKLSAAEKRLYEEHPQRGYDYLRGSQSVSARARIVTLQHHERCDGCGFPKQIVDAHTFSKIVAIADTYDNLTSDTPRHSAIPANEALEYILGNAGSQYDIDCVRAFNARVIPYPVGTLIRLSNGSVAIVREINHNFPMRPIVEILKYRKCIDLLNVMDLTITGVCYDENLEEGRASDGKRL